MPNFGERLKKLREKANLTQRQFAERLGKSSPMIVSRWERGLTYPRTDELEGLAAVLECSVGDMFPGQTEERTALEMEFLDLVIRIQDLDPGFAFNIGRGAPAFSSLTDVQVRAIAELLTAYLRSLSK